MKKIRLFAFPSHQTRDRTSGVDWLRIIQPMRALIKHPDFKKVEIYDPFTKDELMKPRFAIDIAKKFDVIYLNYILNDWGYANIAAIAKKFGVKIILDIDDALWYIKEDNSAYEAYKKGSRGIAILNAILNDVDHITCTTKYLKNIILNMTYRKPEDVTVLPNFVDLELYSYRGKAKDSYPINIYHFGCFDDQTEILTENGFKLFKDLSSNEKVATLNQSTNVLEYQRPISYIEYPYSGKLICGEGKQFSYAVTPNHQLYTSYDKRRGFKIRVAEDNYKKYFRLKKDALWEGKDQKHFFLDNKKITIDDWLKFFGFWLAEGWTSATKYKGQSGNMVDCMQVGLVQRKNNGNLEIIEKILQSYHYTAKIDKRRQIRVCNKILWNYLKQFGKAQDKFVPKTLKSLPKEKLKVLLEWYLKGDGHIDKSGKIRATTTSKMLVDDLCEIALKIGWSANVYSKEAKDHIIEGRFIPKEHCRPCWYLTLLRDTGDKNCLYPKVFTKHQSKKDYDGFVYDVEVPNHTLYVRRNGKCMWSGNSTTHFISLQEQEFIKGMDRIMKEYPNVVFKTMGANIPKFKNMWSTRYQNLFGDRDIIKWIKGPYIEMMKDADLFVTPLTVDKYNQAKSATKFNEISAACKPGVYQRIRQYEGVVDHGKNGFLATNEGEWHRSIKSLLDSRELRKNIGMAAFETVKNWTMQNNIDKYADFFKMVLTR